MTVRSLSLEGWTSGSSKAVRSTALQKFLQKMCSLGGAGGENFGSDFGLGEVALVQGGGDVSRFVFVAKGDGGTAKATASHAAAEDASIKADLLCDLDHEVELGAGNIEVVTQGIMGVLHEFADILVFAGLEAFGGGDGAGDFADDVAGTAVDTVAHRFLGCFDILDGGVAPTAFSDGGESVFGVLAAGGVTSVGEVVRDAGVGDDDFEIGIGEGDQFGFAVLAIDEDELVLLTECGGELIHDAAGDTGEVMLRFLGEKGFFLGFESGVEKSF